MLWGPGVARWCLTGCLLLPPLPDGDLTDTVSGPRSTTSDPTSSKASTKSPTQRHNPFSEDPAETMSSSDTPVHTTSQGKGESHTLDLPDACTELEVIRSAGVGGTSGCPSRLLPASCFGPRAPGPHPRGRTGIFLETKGFSGGSWSKRKQRA